MSKDSPNRAPPWVQNAPSHWRVESIRAATEPLAIRGRPDLPLLSVYRDYGVILRDSRDDNYNPKGEDLSAYKVVEPRNLVLNKMKTWQGSLGVSAHDGIVSPAYIVCRIRNDLNPWFIHHLLRSRPYIVEYGRRSSGVRVNQWDLRYDDFKAIPLLVPPRAEQDEIVTFLDRNLGQIDQYIANKRQQIELYEEQLMVAVNRLTLAGLQEHGVVIQTNVSWLNSAPSHWRVTPLKRAFSSMDYGTSQATIDDGAIPVLTMAHIRNRKALIPERGGVNVLPEGLLLKDGDLLFNRTNSAELVGKVGLYGEVSDRKVTFASYLVRLRPKPTVFSPFMNYLLNSPTILNEARRLAVPSLHQSNLNPTRYGRLPIALPPLTEQVEIACLLKEEENRINRAVNLLTNQIICMTEYRTALIAEAVTGRLDLRRAD